MGGRSWLRISLLQRGQDREDSPRFQDPVDPRVRGGRIAGFRAHLRDRADEAEVSTGPNDGSGIDLGDAPERPSFPLYEGSALRAWKFTHHLAVIESDAVLGPAAGAGELLGDEHRTLPHDHAIKARDYLPSGGRWSKERDTLRIRFIPSYAFFYYCSLIIVPINLLQFIIPPGNQRHQTINHPLSFYFGYASSRLMTGCVSITN